MSKAVNPPIFTGQFKVSQPPPEHTFSVAVSIHSLSKNKGALRVADFDSLLTTVKALGAEERRSKLSRLKKLNDRHKLSQLDLPVATTPQDFSNLAS